MVRARVVVRDPHHQQRHDQAHPSTVKQVRVRHRQLANLETLREDRLRRPPEQARSNHTRHRHPAHQRRRRLLLDEVHPADANERRDDRQSAQHKRINHRRIRAHRQVAHQHAADQAHRIRFENVRRHARAVAHVVAHVVGNGRRIPRIILIQILLILAHQIRAHVRRLGINTTAQSRKHTDQRAAQRQPHQRIDRMLRVVHAAFHHQIKHPHRQQAQRHDEQTRHRTAIESHLQRRMTAHRGRLRRAHVRPHRDHHPDVSRRQRAHRAHHKTRGRQSAAQPPDRRKHHHRDHAHRHHLPVQVGLRPLLDRARDRRHFLISRIRTHDLPDQDECKNKPHNRKGDGKGDAVGQQEGWRHE